MSPFDSAKYKALLEGLDITELSLSRVLDGNTVFRYDSEYFAKYALQALAVLKKRNPSTLDKLAVQITDGIHQSIPFVQDGPVRIVSAKHPKENFFDLDECETVTASFHAANPRTALRENDVIVSTVGTIGNAAVVTADMLPANSDRHVGIIRLSNQIAPRVLSTFLLSRYGKVQTKREVTGNVQPNLFISKLNNLLIPEIPDKVAETVDLVVRKAYALRRDALTHFDEARGLLLDALGLKNWSPPERAYAVRHFSEVVQAGRMDAEFFDPAAAAMVALLRQKGARPLRKVAIVETGYPWRSEFFIENGSGAGEPFVRIRDCKPGVLSREDLDLLDREYAHSQGQPKAQRGELVVGMDGLKWFYAALLSQPVFVNQRVAIIRPTESSTYSPELLLVVLNSIVGQQQFLRAMTIAHTVGHITLDDIRDLLLPEIEHGIAARITNGVRKAHSAETASRLQLERAKRAVELSIEKSEKFALDLLAKGDT